VRLVNEAGDEVPDGEVGELLVEAPSAGEGYWNQRAKSRQTFEGHWTRTGDKYIRDAEGRYTFCGRSRRHVQGLRHLGLAVRGRERADRPPRDPGGRRGARGRSGRVVEAKGLVVLRADTNTDGLHEALKEHVKQKIGPWKYPRWIDVVDSLPKTATGKIQRFKLRDGAS
jgi:4-hydroxybenzoate-CoA ligase